MEKIKNKANKIGATIIHISLKTKIVSNETRT